jgi:hypothetical protein
VAAFPSEVVISVHIPKCAGTSFRHVLQRLYGERLWLNYEACFSREQARHAAVPENVACIHGHFLADTFNDRIAARRLITWVRHPVERLVSNYYHFLRSPDLRDDSCRQLLERELSLREFAELEWSQNVMSRYLAGCPLDAFAFIGVAERFHASLGLFGATVGHAVSGPPPRVNVNPSRPAGRYALPEGERDYLLWLNDADFVLYQSAVARLEAAVAADPRLAAMDAAGPDNRAEFAD